MAVSRSNGGSSGTASPSAPFAACEEDDECMKRERASSSASLV